jgi:uncharacterized membrane protein YbhN (UPF0104 family)
LPLKSKRIRTIVGIVVIIVLFYFLGKSLLQNWHTIVEAKLRFNIFFLVLSFFFMSLHFILVAYTWKRNLRMLREKISLAAALRINALATLPKYAPGKVWGILGKGYLAKREGISEHGCVITISLETILFLLGGIILFLVTASSLAKSAMPNIFYWVLILICLIVTYPKILIKITNLILSMFKRPLIDFMPNYFQVLEILFLYTICWVIQGIGIYFLFKSFLVIPINSLLLIAGIHAFSWVVGFVTIITPAGLGVKEGIFSYFLTTVLPSGVSVLGALVVRIWGTIGELLYFLIFSTKIKKYL